MSFLERADVKFPDVMTKHKEGFPRFRLIEHDGLFATIFPDTYLHLQPLKSNIVSFQEAPVAPIRYSKEILDVFSAEDIPRFPFPNLPAFFLGACQRYSSTQDPIFAMIAQQLVDGMDLDEQWCSCFVPSSMDKELDFALSLVIKKSEPEVGWKPDTIPRFNAEQAEALDILHIPGRDIPINGGKRWREEEDDKDSASGYSENDGFKDDAAYLHKLKQDVRFRMLP